MQWVISKLLGLWRGYGPAECTDAFHTPCAMLHPLGLVKIRRGDKQLMLSNHRVNGVYFMQWVISKSLGLWRGDFRFECTGAFQTPLVTLPLLGLVKICRCEK